MSKRTNTRQPKVPSSDATPSKAKRKRITPKRRIAPLPWIVDGIDYGPAILAIEDLAEWAFDLARENVTGWPEGIRRVKNGRRAVLDMLRGRGSSAANEDVVFTALLLIRILDADLELGANEILAVLAELGLPTDDVPPPRPPRPRRAVVRMPQPPGAASAALAAMLGIPLDAPLAPVVPITRPRGAQAVVTPQARATHTAFSVAA